MFWTDSEAGSFVSSYGCGNENLSPVTAGTDWITDWLTDSTEQSPSWEANRSSVSQEIPRILWNQKFHCHIYKSPPPIPILSQLNPAHALKILFDVILSYALGPPKWPPSFRLPYQNPVCTSLFPHTWYLPRPSHFSRFDNRNNIWW
jgi:hypothetical protein